MRLTGLLLSQSPSHAGEVRDPEIKYNAVASLAAIIQDSDVDSLISSGAITGLVLLLRTQDDLTQQHVVALLKKIVRSPNCRAELRKSNECMSVLFESSAESGLRCAVLEIISELTKQDQDFLSSVPEGV